MYAYSCGDRVVVMGLDRLFEDGVVECPHADYRELREQDPVHRVAGTDVYLVSRVDLIKQVVGDPARFSSRTGEFLHLGDAGRVGVRPPIGLVGNDDEAFGVLATADPPVHGRHRGLLSRILSTASVNRREGEYRRLVDDALDAPLSSGHVEWMSEIAEPLPMLMVTRLLGVADRDAPVLKQQGYAAVELISGFVADADVPGLQAKLVELGPAIEAFSAACTSVAPDTTTVVGICARALAGGELDELEAFGILATLLAAGGESTTSLLGAGVRILAERPDLQDRLRPTRPYSPLSSRRPAGSNHPSGATAGGWSPTPPSATWRSRPDHDSCSSGRQPTGTARWGPTRSTSNSPTRASTWGSAGASTSASGAPLARMEARVTFGRLLTGTRSFAITPGSQLRHHRSLMIRRLTGLPLDLVPAR